MQGSTVFAASMHEAYSPAAAATRSVYICGPCDGFMWRDVPCLVLDRTVFTTLLTAAAAFLDPRSKNFLVHLALV